MNTSQLLASTMLAAGGALYNGGTLVFYSGTQPTTPEAALSGNTALCTFNFSATAFAAPTFSTPNEQMVASFTSTSATPAATGTVSFARAWESNGTTAIADYTVGLTGTDITIGNTGIQIGVPVTLSSFTQKLPAV